MKVENDDDSPIIVIEDDGDYGNPRKQFVRNPYYRGKDPMKEAIWKVENANGTWGFVRNPFAPKPESDLNTSTYDKFKQKGFFQPEVDPY